MTLKLIGKRNVLAAGTAVASDETITIEVLDLIVTIEFKEVSGSSTETSLKSENKNLTFTLTNWSNALGAAVQSEIGKVGDKPLLAALFVHTLGDKEKSRYRLVNYSFSVGELPS